MKPAVRRSSSTSSCTVSLWMTFHWPWIECTDRHTVGGRPQKVGFILTAVQMWTDGIISLQSDWDWSPLLKHAELSLNDDTDCKAKRDSVHSLVKQGGKQTTSCRAKKCDIHTNSPIDCLYKTANCRVTKETVLRLVTNFASSVSQDRTKESKSRAHFEDEVTEAQFNSNQKQFHYKHEVKLNHVLKYISSAAHIFTKILVGIQCHSPVS